MKCKNNLPPDHPYFESKTEKQWRKAGRDKWQKLQTCAAYYGYAGDGAFHDSLEDVRATLYCFYAMQNS